MRHQIILLVLCLLIFVLPVYAQSDDDDYTHDQDIIVNAELPDSEADYLDPSFEARVDDYYSPCRNDTDAVIFSWHGLHRDDRPPFDPLRQAIHFYCADRDLYAPHDGIVWNTTMRYGGMIFIDDVQNNTCMILLGMETINEALEAGATVQTGDYLGRYMYKLHFAVTRGACVDANWYDPPARRLEVPIAFVEMGDVLRNDLRENRAVPFVSQNPGGADTSD